MLTAHLPAGYVFARSLPNDTLAVMPAALLGSILPDLDMIWFYLVDQQSIHHHRYWVHIPFFWALLSVPTLLLVPARWRPSAVVFFAALFLHLILDSIGGGIMWGAPFSDHLFHLVEVPATQSHWVLSFVLHWTFVAEMLIWGAAFWLWRSRSMS